MQGFVNQDFKVIWRLLERHLKQCYSVEGISIKSIRLYKQMNYLGKHTLIKASFFCCFSLLLVLLVGLFPKLSIAQNQRVGTDITSLNIITKANPSNSITETRGDSEFEGKSFTLNFLGLTQSIKELSFESGKAKVEGNTPARVYVQRKPSTDTRQLAWYFGTLNPESNGFTFLSSGPLSEEQLFSENNILAGYDNVFTNTGANVQNRPYNGNASIERLDFVLENPIQSSDNTGFVVLERGAVTGHDGFKIAAITGINPSGSPTSYGSVFTFEANSWGKFPLVTPIPQTYFVNNIADGGKGIPKNPALTIPAGQTLGGVLIRTGVMAMSGQNIYGYSIFGIDVTCSSTELTNIQNSCFPSETGTNGGIDLPAANLGAVSLQPGV